MARFPFNIPAAQPYAGPSGGIRVFGAGRDRGRRLHAGCDLYAPVGTPIFAIAAGEVILDPYPFYLGTHAIEVFHPGVGVVRYGEVMSPSKYPSFQQSLRAGFTRSGITDAPAAISAPRLRAGMPITEGMLIAAVGKLTGIPNPMLHFELFQEAARGRSLSGGGQFRRSAFLLNPTRLLQDLERARASATTAPRAAAVADPAMSLPAGAVASGGRLF
jgi:murein DD-endopeptidase MepM/ murein hydrolase activator NlpD